MWPFYENNKTQGLAFFLRIIFKERTKDKLSEKEQTEYHKICIVCIMSLKEFPFD